jgi:homoserine kinase
MHASVEFAQRLSAFSSLLLTGRFDEALSVMKDDIAEPYRAPLIKGFIEAKASLPALGAEIVSVSGAGPTLFTVCKTLDAAKRCSRWLEQNYINEQGFCHICKLDNNGTRQLMVL